MPDEFEMPCVDPKESEWSDEWNCVLGSVRHYANAMTSASIEQSRKQMEATMKRMVRRHRFLMEDP